MVEREVITSRDNRRIKDLRKLHQRKYRRKQDQFLIEGYHLVEEALKHDQKLHNVILLENYETGGLDLSDVEKIIVDAEVMSSLSSLETPPGIIATVTYIPPESAGRRTLLIDFVQDPGNLGTLIRTADAFGFDKVIVSPDTVDAFSDKVLRSAQGSTFHVHISVEAPVSAARDFTGTVVGTALDGSVPPGEVKIGSEPLMLVLGNEGRGVSKDVLSLADQRVRIEMTGRSESLNVGIAGGILMHHFKA